MSAKRDYTLIASGCDDQTDTRLSLTDEERAVVEYVVATLNAESSYGCQPTLKFEEGYTRPLDEDDDE